MKQKKIWVLQGRYEDGWEDLTTETSKEDIIRRRTEYELNEPHTMLRIQHRRDEQ